MSRFTPFVLVGLGGLLGANARFLLSRWAGSLTDTPFPLGTFLANVVGCFVLGAVATLATERVMPHADAVRLAAGVGFVGALTTFSTFEFETHALLEDGAWWLALANVVASVVGGFVALRLGVLLGRWWLG